ncbi:MAG: AAA family ATPase [Pseudomonadales bacterium]|nr:AAA family ATPase [Pseudomonadales bacterium]
MSTDLIKALQNPELYDHPVAEFKVMETHISWVILTGPYAYKIKKPVNFGFLDFSTLTQREHFCKEELRLNRRLAESLYLDVIPITGTPDTPAFNAGGEPFEYAIKMEQFAQEGLLDRLQENNALKAEHIDQLSDIIAEFHQKIEPVANTTQLGTPEAIFAPVAQNFEQIRPLLNDDKQLKQLEQLEGWANSAYARLKDEFQRRKDEGHIKECHGDIHLGNVTLQDNKVILFDCIEFNDDFRCIDTLSDLAFLLMDLENRGLDHFSRRLFNRYLEKTGDYQALPLVYFYKAYRAMVRAKIALFTMGNPSLDDAARAELLDTYQRYADLAERYSFVPNRYLLLTHGLSGSGKSTVAKALVESLGVIQLRSDVERKRLCALAVNSDATAAVGEGIYTQEITQKTYERLATLSELALHSGFAVLIDATNLKRWQRTLCSEIAEKEGVACILIDCDADPETIKTWITQRAETGQDASDATLEVLEAQQQSQEPLDAEEQEHTLKVRTDEEGQVEALINSLRKKLSL